ncbi:MAG TPA: hypothetical protein VK186_26605, partial [Candidatus Deferrimicrobium sp.]|nr:hypothetical protein [Candidatus Deferrimicrobium sp.]
MEIPQIVKEAAAKLSRVNLDFLEFAQKNPACLDHSNFKLLELKDELFVLQPWPTFVNKANRNHFEAISLRMWDLAKSIPRRVFNNDLEKMSRFYEVPLSTIAYQMGGVDDGHLESLTGRIDFILSSSGLKCLECNFSASLGGWQVPIWEALYLNTPIIARFFKEKGITSANENLILHFLEHVVHSTPGDIFQKGGKLHLAIVGEGFVDGKISVQSYLNTLYKNILRQRDSALKGRVHMCDYKNLQIVDGFIFHKGEKIHTLVELHRGFVPDEILDVFKTGNIHLINGPVSRVLANKLNLALLSDHENMNVFDPEEKEFIDRYIPWTRKIMPGKTCFAGKIIDLPDFIRSNRQKLVLKPGGS